MGCGRSGRWGGAQCQCPPPIGGGHEARLPYVEGVELADEGEVVVAAGGVGDGGAAVDFDGESGRIQAIAAIDVRIGTIGVADADGVADVAAAVDVSGGNGAAVGRGGRDAAVAGGGGVDELGGRP